MPNTYTKVCAVCGKTFTAHQSRTQCCSDACSKKLYKFNKKKILAERTQQDILEKKREELLSKTFLSISDSAKLLGMSPKTIRKMISNGSLQSIKYGTRLVRISVDDLKNPQIQKNEPIRNDDVDLSQYYTVKDALSHFEISLTWFYHKIKPLNITPITFKGCAYYPKETLERVFYKKKYAQIQEWFSVSEIAEKYHLRDNYVYEFISDHKEIPRKRQGKNVLISKVDWENARGINMANNEDYYSIPEATKVFSVGRSHLYDVIREHKIDKIKIGHSIYVLKEDLNRIMLNRKN